MNSRNIKVAVVDDHLLVLNGLEMMLRAFPDLILVFKATSAMELFQRLAETLPDVLLLDIQMPDGNGLDLCARLQKEYPPIRIIALTNFDEVHYVKNMMRRGASGYLLKNVDPLTLHAAIEAVNMGDTYIQADVRNKLVNETISGQKKSPAGVMLTKRELEILTLIAQEYTNQEIADKLFVSLRTVHSHRINLNQKLGVRNTAGLVNEAHKRGLIP